jgi:hypothetical protein
MRECALPTPCSPSHGLVHGSDLLELVGRGDKPLLRERGRECAEPLVDGPGRKRDLAGLVLIPRREPRAKSACSRAASGVN